MAAEPGKARRMEQERRHRRAARDADMTDQDDWKRKSPPEGGDEPAKDAGEGKDDNVVPFRPRAPARTPSGPPPDAA